MLSSQREGDGERGRGVRERKPIALTNNSVYNNKTRNTQNKYTEMQKCLLQNK